MVQLLVIMKFMKIQQNYWHKSSQKENINIVYGGSVQGLMGIVSNEAMSLGNIVTGVITYDLSNKEIENKNISKIYKVNTINEKKRKNGRVS